MELNNEFRVGVSVPETWKVLTDVERIAPMLPGAQLQEVEGDEYRGVVKVKVGPITAQYKGTATFIEQDESAGRVVIKASGRDTRGQGNASATITATMTPDGDGTNVRVVTDLTVTGKVAQFGRGVLADVSSKLIGQFVSTLEKDLEAGGTATAPTNPGPESAEESAEGSADSASDSRVDTDGSGANGSGPAAQASGPRRIEAPEAEPVDLLAVAGGSTMKRLAPVAAVVALVLLVLLRRSRRR
jgi:carbon monoxide dehydrogenase subunit G